jgi:hypothetical protein
MTIIPRFYAGVVSEITAINQYLPVGSMDNGKANTPETSAFRGFHCSDMFMFYILSIFSGLIKIRRRGAQLISPTFGF